MGSWRETLRFLKDPYTEYDPDYDIELTVVASSDFADDDDEYLVDPWILWPLLSVAGALLVAGCVFYWSYKHELFARDDKEMGGQDESLREGELIL